MHSNRLFEVRWRVAYGQYAIQYVQLPPQMPWEFASIILKTVPQYPLPCDQIQLFAGARLHHRYQQQPLGDQFVRTGADIHFTVGEVVLPLRPVNPEHQFVGGNGILNRFCRLNAFVPNR